MNLIDVLNMYASLHNSENLFLLLQDYELDNRIDRDLMNRIIIKKLGSNRPLSNNSQIFKFMLEEFFSQYKYNISKLLDTMYYEYDPLTNKDWKRELNEVGTEDVIDTGTEHRESVGDIDNTDKYTTDGSLSDTENSTDEHLVSAYDVSTYQPKDKTIGNSTDNQTTKTEHSGVTTSDIKSDVDTESKDITDRDTTRAVVEKFKGKDSDESFQSLIEQERDLAQFNIFDWIIQLMRKELFLLVY